MAGLQRSQISFRRQGSSGLIWDDKLLSGELNPDQKPSAEGDPDQKDDHQKAELRRTKSDGGGGAKRSHHHRSIKVEQAEDPPSPRVSGCGFCSAFSKPSAKTAKRKSGKRKA